MESHEGHGRLVGSGRGRSDTEGPLEAARERTCFLEWRVEELQAIVEDERRVAARQREELSMLSRREADATNGVRDLEARLSDARRECSMWRAQSEQAEAVRSELELELGQRNAHALRELDDLRRQLSLERRVADDRKEENEHLRGRLEMLEESRERFFRRLVEWQERVGMGDREDVDLAQFIAELREEIVHLSTERERAMGHVERLRQLLLDAGAKTDCATSDAVTPPETVASPAPKMAPRIDCAPNDEGVALCIDELFRGEGPDRRLSGARELVRRIGALAAPMLVAALDASADSTDRVGLLDLLATVDAPDARRAMESALVDVDALVRATAYEASFRVFASEKAKIDSLVEAGLGDGDPRVRRRVVVAYTSGRAWEPAPLAKLLKDPDPHTRRVACVAVAGCKNASVLRAVARLLLDDHASVRAAAARAVGRSVGRDLSSIAASGEFERRRGVARLRTELEPRGTGPMK